MKILKSLLIAILFLTALGFIGLGFIDVSVQQQEITQAVPQEIIDSRLGN